MSEKPYELTWCDILKPKVQYVPDQFATMTEVLQFLEKLPKTARWHLTFYPMKETISEGIAVKKFTKSLLPDFNFK